MNVYGIGGIVEPSPDGFDLVVGNILNLDIAMVTHPNSIFSYQGEVAFGVFPSESKGNYVAQGLGLNDVVKQMFGRF